MKNHLLLTLFCLLLACCLLLSGCGADDSETIPADDPVADEIPADDGLGGDGPAEMETPDASGFVGSYTSDYDGDWNMLEVYDDGSWTLSGDNADLTGWLEYDPEYESFYAYNDADGSGCRFEWTEDGRIYMSAYGYFSPDDGSSDIPQNEDAGGEGEYIEYDEDEGWADADYHVDVSEFAGTWYCDGDLAADRYIVIDENGDWTYYSRASGDAEGEALDAGFLTPADGEVSTYYADSYWYEDVRYRVFDFDTGILSWDEEGVFERMD